jgi:hypothetical protein
MSSSDAEKDLLCPLPQFDQLELQELNLQVYQHNVSRGGSRVHISLFFHFAVPE